MLLSEGNAFEPAVPATINFADNPLANLAAPSLLVTSTSAGKGKEAFLLSLLAGLRTASPAPDPLHMVAVWGLRALGATFPGCWRRTREGDTCRREAEERAWSSSRMQRVAPSC